MSFVMSNLLLCGILLLKPSEMSCVNCVSSVIIKCCGLKPRWLGDSVIYRFKKFSMNLSITLQALLSHVICLYEMTYVGTLFG